MLDHTFYARVLKALSDPNRLRIIDMLASGEMCSCRILEFFDFTQPTLSHHMKVLTECGLLNCRKEGLWSYFSLNHQNYNKLMLFMIGIATDTDNCLCKGCHSVKNRGEFPVRCGEAHCSPPAIEQE